MQSKDWVFGLKARKMGFTEIAAGFDGWVLRFKPNARVHLFSQGQDGAYNLADRVRFGLSRLPDWMQLPEDGAKDRIVLTAGKDDTRVAQAYPSTLTGGIDLTATHTHLDEFAKMLDPDAVWQAAEPSANVGSCHIVTVGRGPANLTATLWRGALAGTNRFTPVFAAWNERPGRDVEWYAATAREHTQEAMRHEYPSSWEDALAGTADYPFKGHFMDACAVGAIGETAVQAGHYYVKAWDIGLVRDAAVGIVVDVTLKPYQVVHYERWRGMAAPHIQRQIEMVHVHYPGPTWIEENSMGLAIIQNLSIAVEGFKTTGKSKPAAISALQLLVEQGNWKHHPAQHHQLDEEMRGYQWDDKALVQDSVMAAAIAASAISETDIPQLVPKVSSGQPIVLSRAGAGTPRW